MMITLHTLENAYDDGNDYHQFVQRGTQHLLDSTALASDHTLRSFLVADVMGALDEQDPRVYKVLAAVLEIGDIPKLLSYCERRNMVDIPGAGHTSETRFGEWTFDTVVIEPPSLRELQEDVWDSDEQFTREDWQHEVANGDSHIGYWEWVEHMREFDEEEPE